MASTDYLTPEVLAAAIRDIAAVLDQVVVCRGQVTNLDRDLRAKLSGAVRSLFPPPAAPTSDASTATSREERS